MNISLAPETLFYIGSSPITNTVFTAFIVTIIIVFFSFYINSVLSTRKPGKVQLLIEMVLNGLLSLVNDVMDPKFAKKVFGFLMTFFVLILISNWFGLLPIVPSISFEESEESAHAEEADEEQEGSLLSCLQTQHCYLSTNGIKEFHSSTHLLRAPSSDLSLTVSLALISVIVTNAIGINKLGASYFKKYINVKGPIDFVVGILEIFSELGKIISFSFRLFGNVFAGEVLLAVITGLTLGIATFPFFGLEIFVGAIQAFVFFFLTAVFIGLAVSQHH